MKMDRCEFKLFVAWCFLLIIFTIGIGQGFGWSYVMLGFVTAVAVIVVVIVLMFVWSIINGALDKLYDYLSNR